MLKKTLNIKEKVDISSYSSLSAYLKVASQDYEPKQARIFTEEEMQRFLDSAPDDLWLDVKVSSLFIYFFHFSLSYLTSLFCFSIIAGGLRIWNNGCLSNTRAATDTIGTHNTVR